MIKVRLSRREKYRKARNEATAKFPCKPDEVFTTNPNIRKNWKLYNLASTSEKELFLKIINSAVNSMNIEYKYNKRGQPPLPLDDMLKIIIIKVYNGFSARRTIFDLKLAYALGYVRHVPHFNSICTYMRNPELYPLLQKLCKVLAKPLKNIETKFAIDASGFGEPHRRKWRDVRFSRVSRYKREIKDYKKLHAVSGVITNIISSAKVTIGKAGDSPHFIDLVRQTSFNFKIKEVFGDPAYLAKKNVDLVHQLGGVAYIKPRSNTRVRKLRASIAWREMIALYRDYEGVFKHHYSLRSNVESTFSMMKAKFSGFVRSKDKQGQFNEIMAKVCAHNCAVLVMGLFALDIDLPHLNQKNALQNRR